MATKRAKRGAGDKAGPKATITLLILRDGVCIADNDPRNKGEKCEVVRDIAEKIIGNGHGKAV